MLNVYRMCREIIYFLKKVMKYSKPQEHICGSLNVFVRKVGFV